jgi:DMSO/TMAO reductase YedYZ molybdopterin-dependent catalytic subunit
MFAMQLPPGQQLVATGKWPLVGEKSPGASVEPWTVRVHGLVDSPLLLSLTDLAALPRVERAIDIHCVTRWSKPDVRFGGALLADLLTLAQSQTQSRFVSFVARSERSHSTSLVLSEALELGTLLALECNGEPLATEHGGPVRMVTPGRYFYKSLKWLAEIELLAEDRLGYWEANAGYHNHADPWCEERYLAPGLTKQEAASILGSRDWSRRDLRSIDAGGRELRGLMAQGALLRNANFRHCDLQEAAFREANLSNAHLQFADLRGASFLGADCEGADFSGADLRGADFAGASLFGASFCDQAAARDWAAAQIDQTTRIEVAAIEQLTPMQQEFVRKAFGSRI